MKIIVFDVGRTLMEYVDMPISWLEYYPAAVRHIRDSLSLPLSDEQLDETLRVYRGFSPRVRYTEEVFTPEHIFTKATAHWDCDFVLEDVINAFFEGIGLRAYIYPDSIPCLNELKRRGYTVCTLTDVATGMPDEMHKSYFPQLMPHFDYYVSSSICGHRKPNLAGLKLIEQHFGVPMSEYTFVGDEKKDVDIAKRAGCRSVLICREGEPSDFGQDFTVKDLNELLNISEI